MPKPKSQKIVASSRLNNFRYSEAALVFFAAVFATFGSYFWMQSYAAPEDGIVISQSRVSAEEQTWFSSVAGAGALILATGPIAVLFLWWLWRRSERGLIFKSVMTLMPILAVMAFT